MKKKILKFLFILLGASTGLAIESNDFEWIQYIRDNKLMARATTLKNECPKITIDGKEFQMLFRAEKYDLELKQTVRICEKEVTNAKQVSIRNNNLKLPPKQINRFIVIGDTGCEASFFDKRFVKQECSDPNSWPFKKVADKVVEATPDFIIHMGDYSYRNKYDTQEDAIKNKSLQWFFYKQDFFEPASDMLRSAPMLFIRGNHDKCDLMGDAWFLFLDSENYKEECLKKSSTYTLKINDLNFMVFDSSETPSGTEYSAESLKKYKSYFASDIKNLKGKAWLLIHHPVIGLKELAHDEPFYHKVPTPIIYNSFLKDYSKKLPISISGHFHLMADIKRNSDGLEQFIVGNSGTFIHQAKRPSYTYITKDNERVQARVKSGYLQFDRESKNEWKVTAYSLDGEELYVTKVVNTSNS